MAYIEYLRAESSEAVSLKAGTYDDKTALQLTPAKVTAQWLFSWRALRLEGVEVEWQ